MGCSKSSPKKQVIAIQFYLKTQEKPQINNLTLHLKELEKEEQRKPKVSRRKEIIKIREEINEIETKQTIAKINKTKSWFFVKVNRTDQPLARLIKKKRERTQINKIRNEKGEVTTDTAEIQNILRDSNTPLSVIDRDSRQKIRKDIAELNNTTNQLDLIDTFTILHE